MSVEILWDTAKNKSVLFCNTSDRAFGPIFDHGDAADFIEWLQERGRDPREMNENTLDVWVKTWEAEQSGPTDVQVYGAGAR